MSSPACVSWHRGKDSANLPILPISDLFRFCPPGVEIAIGVGDQFVHFLPRPMRCVIGHDQRRAEKHVAPGLRFVASREGQHQSTVLPISRTCPVFGPPNIGPVPFSDLLRDAFACLRATAAWVVVVFARNPAV